MCRMDFPIVIIRMSLFAFRGIGSIFFIFISFFDENHVSKQNSPRCDAAFSHFAASHLGLFSLHMTPGYGINVAISLNIIHPSYDLVHNVEIVNCQC